MSLIVRPSVRTSATLWTFASFALAGSSALAQVQIGDDHPASFTSPQHYAGTAAPAGREVRWSHTLHHPGATYLALHFVDFNLAEDDELIVEDATGGQRYSMTGRGKMNAGTFWARHVRGDTIQLQLLVGSASGGDGFIIDKYAAGRPEAETFFEPRAICDADDRDNAVCYRDSLPVVYDHCRAACRLVIQGSTGCSGALVSPFNHVLTNNHCVQDPADAVDVDFDFMAEAPTCETPNCRACFPGIVYSGSRMVQTHFGYDDVLLQIVDADPASNFGYLEVESRSPMLGEQIYNPQFSGLYAKTIAYYSSHPSDTGGVARITSLTEATCLASSGINEVGYYLDGFGGSSGSPIIAFATHKLIALHHCGGCPNRGVPASLIYPEIAPFVTGEPRLGGLAPGALTVSADSLTPPMTADSAVDASLGTLWTSATTPGPHWLQIDLGHTAVVTGYRIRHASSNGTSPASLNSRSFEIQSAAGAAGPWTTEYMGANPGQAAASTFQYVNPRKVRHLRVLITDPGSDPAARIAEFEVFGPAQMIDATPAGTNIAPQRASVIASSQFNASLGGDKAVDGIISLDSRWVSAPTSPPHNLTLDLGRLVTVSGFILRQAANVESAGYNADAFSIRSARSASGPWHIETNVLTYGGAPAVTRAFASPKTMRYVRLVVTDPGPKNDPFARIPEFEVIESPGTPQAAFLATPIEGRAPLTVQFADLSTNAPNTWTWTFGDGTLPAHDQEPAHTYTQAGLHSVTLVAGGPTGPMTRTANAYIEVLPRITVRVDFDGDGDVDQVDFGLFQSCLTGPGAALTDPACTPARLDGDSDVDAQDFMIFRGCLSGADIPVDPACIP